MGKTILSSSVSTAEISFRSRMRSDSHLSSGTLPSRTSNAIRWSPRGRHVVLATVGSSSKSELEFWDLDFNVDDAGRREGQVSKEEWGSGIQLLGTADHYALTDVEWDPSGRYLATSASSWTHTVRMDRFRAMQTLFSLPSTARKWLRYLGLPWPGNHETHPRSVQTVHLAAATSDATHQGPATPGTQKPEGIQPDLRRG